MFRRGVEHGAIGAFRGLQIAGLMVLDAIPYAIVDIETPGRCRGIVVPGGRARDTGGAAASGAFPE
jgi:hypothetical protein